MWPTIAPAKLASGFHTSRGESSSSFTESNDPLPGRTRSGPAQKPPPVRFQADRHQIHRHTTMFFALLHYGAYFGINWKWSTTTTEILTSGSGNEDLATDLPGQPQVNFQHYAGYVKVPDALL
ncbi:hypothetical protein FNV43_RR13069 [Rhamnella rubrinervis]|uniref:Uncharacterized protein n=1 Tax=Rhamnella rubrinervis TaxID=2594499 RepID=A0A8K0H0D3_9ROSA|nr:hypothetical protein FNV43_RR13069 [Rhamnella rubrinervis]